MSDIVEVTLYNKQVLLFKRKDRYADELVITAHGALLNILKDGNVYTKICKPQMGNRTTYFYAKLGKEATVSLEEIGKRIGGGKGVLPHQVQDYLLSRYQVKRFNFWDKLIYSNSESKKSIKNWMKKNDSFDVLMVKTQKKRMGDTYFSGVMKALEAQNAGCYKKIHCSFCRVA
jgi:hypothetical protein